MTIQPSFTPMFDRLLDFSVRAETEADVAAARVEYFAWTGEVFDEDRSFDVRMQAFLDWYVFDRFSPVLGDTPARAMAASLPDAYERQTFRLMSRTVHGLFEIEEIRPTHVRVMNLLTAMPYVVEVAKPANKGVLFALGGAVVLLLGAVIFLAMSKSEPAASGLTAAATAEPAKTAEAASAAAAPASAEVASAPAASATAAAQAASPAGDQPAPQAAAARPAAAPQAGAAAAPKPAAAAPAPAAAPPKVSTGGCAPDDLMCLMRAGAKKKK